MRAGGENGSGDGDEEWSAMLAGDETNEWRKEGRGGGGNERTDGQMDGRTSEGGGSALGFEAFLWFSRVGDLAGESAGQVYGGHYVPTRPLGKSIGRLCIFEWVGINANPSRL